MVTAAISSLLAALKVAVWLLQLWPAGGARCEPVVPCLGCCVGSRWVPVKRSAAPYGILVCKDLTPDEPGEWQLARCECTVTRPALCACRARSAHGWKGIDFWIEKDGRTLLAVCQWLKGTSHDACCCTGCAGMLLCCCSGVCQHGPWWRHGYRWRPAGCSSRWCGQQPGWCSSQAGAGAPSSTHIW